MRPILVVDDEPQIVRAIKTSLEARDYVVLVAATGLEAVNLAASSEPELIILDLGLPDMGGVEVARRVRAFSDAPIIILTVEEALATKVAALDAGADDYVTKPFSMEELLARMRATLRRAASTLPAKQSLVAFGDIEVDLIKQTVKKAGERVHLTPKEYALLEALVTNPGKLLTHRWLLSKVWGPGYSEESHYLRVFVGQLRKKLGEESEGLPWIRTEAGVGYRWEEDR